MTARHRILALRLMGKLEKYPAYAKALGIEATGAGKHQNAHINQKSLTDL